MSSSFVSIKKKCTRKRKCCLTLLEVVIALFLTAILLTELFSAYSLFHRVHIKIALQKERYLMRQAAQQRLSQVFGSIRTMPVPDFFTTFSPLSRAPILFFSFDNGTDLNPDFSNLIKGALFLDQQQRLLLVSYSRSGAQRTDLLLDKISSVSFAFFDSVGLQSRSTWPESLKRVPPMLTMTIQELPREKETARSFSFAYFLETESSVIAY